MAASSFYTLSVILVSVRSSGKHTLRFTFLRLQTLCCAMGVPTCCLPIVPLPEKRRVIEGFVVPCIPQEFRCEICGNASYWGRRAFERHFKEWRHQNGMRALGIPNTKNFFEVTQMKDALELWASIRVRCRPFILLHATPPWGCLQHMCRLHCSVQCGAHFLPVTFCMHHGWRPRKLQSSAQHQARHPMLPFKGRQNWN